MTNWQKIYSTTNPYHAEIVKGVLGIHALSAVLVNRKDTLYHFGTCEVYVSADDTIKALKVIEDEIKFE